MKNSGKRCLSLRCLENLLYHYFRSKANLDLASAAESTWPGSVFLAWALSMQTDRLCASPGTVCHSHSYTASELPDSNYDCLSIRALWKCRCSEHSWLSAASLAARSDQSTGLQRGDVVPHLLCLERCSQPSLLRAAIQGCVLSFQAPALPSSTYKKYLTETHGFMQKSSKSYLTILL